MVGPGDTCGGEVPAVGTAVPIAERNDDDASEAEVGKPSTKAMESRVVAIRATMRMTIPRVHRRRNRHRDAKTASAIITVMIETL